MAREIDQDIRYLIGNLQAEITSLKARCGCKERDIEKLQNDTKVLTAWKNKAIGYVSVLVFMLIQFFDQVKNLL